jgi:hypothetical protein
MAHPQEKERESERERWERQRELGREGGGKRGKVDVNLLSFFFGLPHTPPQPQQRAAGGRW